MSDFGFPSEICQILDDICEDADRICRTPEAVYGKTIDSDKIQEKILRNTGTIREILAAFPGYLSSRLKTLWSMTAGRAISAAQLQDCSKRSARNTRRYRM